MNKPLVDRSSLQAVTQSFGSSQTVLYPAAVMVFALGALSLKIGVVMALLERLSMSVTSNL